MAATWRLMKPWQLHGVLRRYAEAYGLAVLRGRKADTGRAWRKLQAVDAVIESRRAAGQPELAERGRQ